MKRYRQFEPILISDFQAKHWQHPEHRHNHYELIYIKQGSGSHVINQVALPYEEGDVFLIGPEEEHYFKIDVLTHFVYLKFTDAYVYQKDEMSAPSMQHLEYLIKSRETHLSGFKLSEHDRQTVGLIFNVIISLKSETLQNEQLIWLQLLTLATMLQRNMPELKVNAGRSRDMQAVFCYVHKHIYTPSKLKSTVIAANFHLSADYIGPYFKRNAGITLRKYIGEYRRSLIEGRIATRNYSLKQIAAEFGLTDESHVSKILHKKIV